MPASMVAAKPLPALPVAKPLPTVKSNGTPAALPKAQSRILSALAQYPGGRTKVQLAVLTGYANGGGAFNNAISALRTAGFLVGDKERIAITEAGYATLGNDWTPLPTGRDLADHWLRELDKAQRSALQVLLDAYPHALSKDELATRAGYAPGTGAINNAISRLRTLELAEGKAHLKASAALMES
jgi:DNA-binding winged helix-turn-helix (wHTH) protein